MTLFCLFLLVYVIAGDVFKAIIVTMFFSIGLNMMESLTENYIPVRYDAQSTVTVAKVNALRDQCGIRIRHDESAATRLKVDEFGKAVVEGVIADEWKNCGVKTI